MADQLTLKKIDPKRDSYQTLYEHPAFGKIDVGRISTRSGNPRGTPDWDWCIVIQTLAPQYRDEQGDWQTRQSIDFRGTAPTRKAAIAAWKSHWPKFRDARTDAEWHDAKVEQDFSRKRMMILDAKKLPRLSDRQKQDLEREMSQAGPAPHWLQEMVKRRRRL